MSYVDSILNKKEYHIALANHVEEDEQQQDISSNIRKYVFTPKSYQLFAKHFMSPLTPTTRVLLKYGTGAGKTATSLYIAMNFVKRNKQTLILGFTKRIFQRELLKYPEFGYANADEIENLRRLKYEADRGGNDTAYAEARSALRRRIKEFSFFGYREFMNRLITYREDINELNEKQIRALVNSGEIKLNKTLMERFRGSLIICDEIHNVYNSVEKNNWGVALQLLLDYLGDDVKVVFLSATPINHRASEIKDITNLLGEKLPDHYTNTDIATALQGKILFVEDSDPRFYPKSETKGEYVKDIEIMKFIKCPASPEQTTVLENVSGSDSYYANDIIFPDIKNETNYVYSSYDVRRLTSSSEVRVIRDGDNVKLMGPMLYAENLPKYSNKYATMLKTLINVFQKGKTLIYHKYVRISGVTLIAEILKQNGFIDEFSDFTDATRDVITGLTYLEHTKQNIKTEFTPARFVIIHSDIDISVRERSIEKFNAPENSRGTKFNILIGAEVIKESYDIKAIRNLFIMHRPENINTMRQIYGRGKRFMSHELLPPEDRTIDYYVFITTYKSENKPSPEVVSYKAICDEYKHIQIIEGILNKIAVDVDLNMKMIEYSFVDKNEIGVHKFEPQHKYRQPINGELYDQIYMQWEVQQCVYLIKRLYTVSLVWTIDDLVSAIKDPPFSVEYNTKLFSRDSVIVALYKLYWQRLPNYKIVLPKMTMGNYITSMFSQVDKILTIHGNKYIITQCNKYFIALPFEEEGDGPAVSYFPESMYRTSQPSRYRLNIREYVNKSNADTKFGVNLEALKKSYKNSTITELYGILCEFNTEFHMGLAKKCVKEIYNTLLSKQKSNMDSFLIRVFCIYSIFDIIIFYRDLSKEKQSSFPFPEYVEKSSKKYSKEDYIKHWETILADPKSLKSMESEIPVGIFIKHSYLFLSDEFVQSEVAPGKIWKDNDILIGFYEKSQTGLRLRFKIRPPQEEVEDSRKRKSGAICTTRPKAEIIEYCKKLGVKLSKSAENELSSAELCNTLRIRLTELEAEERQKNSNIKYFYMYWEL